MQIIAQIDKELYKAVAPGIRSEIVVLTVNQKEHIIKRRGQGFFDCYSRYFAEIAEAPDYIFSDERHPNTAIACKTLDIDGSHVHLVIRLAVAEDEDGYENSVITALIESDKRYAQRLRNKIPLYKRVLIRYNKSTLKGTLEVVDFVATTRPSGQKRCRRALRLPCVPFAFYNKTRCAKQRVFYVSSQAISVRRRADAPRVWM